MQAAMTKLLEVRGVTWFLSMERGAAGDAWFRWTAQLSKPASPRHRPTAGELLCAPGQGHAVRMQGTEELCASMVPEVWPLLHSLEEVSTPRTGPTPVAQSFVG